LSAALKYKNNYQSDPYNKIRKIDGSHAFKDSVSGGYVAYQVRQRKHGKIAYFNYDLAKQMGLISKDHPHKMNRELSKNLLETFAIQIINEHDIINKTPINSKDVKKNTYMATRYLQLQHPSKKGLTSGDGRSIWNGTSSFRGKTWDISSCGTGATCLSPATAINKKFYETGDPTVSYGCGYSEIHEGLGNAIFSEIFHLNNIETERTLLVIEFPKGLSINVRAGQNLLRPSHFFNHLKQDNYDRLKNAVDFFIDRQTSNGNYQKLKTPKSRYNSLLENICKTFAEITALYESEYIFCWLDWDGDNILANGGIIDYGSVRQFGMYHHTYKFDDDDRWSTTIPQQKNKAREIVKTFAQLCDYLITKKKKPLNQFNNHNILNKFDTIFRETKEKLLLKKMGLTEKQTNLLRRKKKKLVKCFMESFTYFERAVSAEGPIEVTDGVTTNAVFCMRDILRELPYLFQKDFASISHESFMDILVSNYALPEDSSLTPKKKAKINQFQADYKKIIQAIAHIEQCSSTKILKQINERSAVINRYERITGDALIHITTKLIKQKQNYTSDQFQKIIESFIHEQNLVPDASTKSSAPKAPPSSKKLISNMMRIIRNHREGI